MHLVAPAKLDITMTEVTLIVNYAIINVQLVVYMLLIVHNVKVILGILIHLVVHVKLDIMMMDKILIAKYVIINVLHAK